jgi:agmatinase
MTAKPVKCGIVLLPFEQTTSFLKGTHKAPDVIAHEFEKIDTFDLTLGRDPKKEFDRFYLAPHGDDVSDPAEQQVAAETTVAKLLENNSLPISLGGEHTVSIGPVKAAGRYAGELGVVQMDAHGDLRDSFDNSRFSHACVMRRIRDMGHSTLGVGVRSISLEEANYISGNDVRLVHAHTVMKKRNWYQLADELPQHCYLTVDMDFFDVSDVPSTSNPEPGGPSFDDAVSFLHYLFKRKTVVAADIVELRPDGDSTASVRMAARLLALIMGLGMS